LRQLHGGQLTVEHHTHLIPGFHAVREALENDLTRIDALWVAENASAARIREILSVAEARRIPVHFMPRAALTRLFPDTAHQGIVAVGEGFAYADLDEVADAGSASEGRRLLVAADHITDEGNLGALIRTAAFFGVQGVIIPKDRSAQVSPLVVKRSSGACGHVPVSRVVNLARTIQTLDKKGFWIVGASGDGPESVYRFDWRRDVVLAVGNEQRGLSLAVKDRCHQLVRIPRFGAVESLNVAVAAGVILSEIARQRDVE
jgi:23S rRNA (guanosine2251-2'-O)-methyltransferase